MPGVRGSTFIPIEEESIEKQFTVPTKWNPPKHLDIDFINEAKAEKYIVGVCTDKCCEQEIERRTLQEDLSTFEIDPVTKGTNKQLAVAEYSRAASNVDHEAATTIRTPDTLIMTVDYLLNNIADRKDHPFSEVYNFLWDRFRAIHKEINMQHVYSPSIICMLEEIGRFCVVTSFLTHGDTKVDSKLLYELFRNISLTLYHAYDDCRLRGIACPNEAEIRSYYIIWDYTKFIYHITELSDRLDILQSKPFQYAIKICTLIQNNQYTLLFNELERYPILYSCLIHVHIHTIRENALKIIKGSSRRTLPFTIENLVKLLFFDDENQAIQFLAQYKIHPDEANEENFKFPARIDEIKIVSFKVQSKVILNRLKKYSIKYLCIHCPFLNDKYETVNIQIPKPIPKPKIYSPETSDAEIEESAESEEERRERERNEAKQKELQRIEAEKQRKDKLRKEALLKLQREKEERKRLEEERRLKEEKRKQKIRMMEEQKELAEKQYNKLLDRVELVKEILQEYLEDFKQIEEENEYNKTMADKVSNFLLKRPHEYMRDAFYRWKSLTQKNRESREYLASMIKERRLNLLDNQSSSFPCFNESESIPELSVDMTVKQLKQLFNPIYLPDIVGNIIENKNPNQKNLYWKMSICSIDINSQSPLSPDYWLQRKLNLSDDSSYIEEIEGCRLFSFYESNFKQDKLFKVACYWISSPVPLVSRCLEGTQSVIYLVHSYASFASHSAQLRAYIELLDSPVPLTILNATRVSNEIVSQKLQISELQDNNEDKIIQWQIQAIPIDCYHRICPNAEKYILDSILWQAKHIPNQPIIIPISIRNLIESFMDTSILDIYNYQQNNDSIKLPEPSGITEMFRRTLGYVYNFIKQNQNTSISWPIREFVRESSNEDDIEITNFNFDPDVHTGSSYYYWNDISTLERLQNALSLLNLPDIPSIDLYNYDECSQCALQYIQFCSKEFKENLSEFYFITTKFIDHYSSSGIFPWGQFLIDFFQTRLIKLEESLSYQDQIIFYEESKDYTILSNLKQIILSNNQNILEYQYKEEMDVDESLSESEEEEEEEIILEDDKELEEYDTEFISLSEYSPETKKYVIRILIFYKLLLTFFL